MPRLEPDDGAPNEKITDWLIKINGLIERLTAGIPAGPAAIASLKFWSLREQPGNSASIR